MRRRLPARFRPCTPTLQNRSGSIEVSFRYKLGMHIVITGASSGIGAALARELARLPGARLTLVARRVALLERLAAELDVPVHVARADLSTDDDGWLAEAEAEHGPVDVLVNNAGAQVVAPTAASTWLRAKHRCG